ncbi:MAG: YHS domain-containing protein [Acidobacteria bacterium]|nr:YHS domain-containing protein [Acidobacteriota bacterium]
MRFLARVLQFIVLVVFATWLGRKLLSWILGPAVRAADPNLHSIPPKEMKSLQRDPVCGTYVSPEISERLIVAGTAHHFCSTACREKFRKMNAVAMSA